MQRFTSPLATAYSAARPTPIVAARGGCSCGYHLPRNIQRCGRVRSRDDKGGPEFPAPPPPLPTPTPAHIYRQMCRCTHPRANRIADNPYGARCFFAHHGNLLKVHCMWCSSQTMRMLVITAVESDDTNLMTFHQINSKGLFQNWESTGGLSGILFSDPPKEYSNLNAL